MNRQRTIDLGHSERSGSVNDVFYIYHFKPKLSGISKWIHRLNKLSAVGTTKYVSKRNERQKNRYFQPYGNFPRSRFSHKIYPPEAVLGWSRGDAAPQISDLHPPD